MHSQIYPDAHTSAVIFLLADVEKFETDRIFGYRKELSKKIFMQNSYFKRLTCPNNDQ